MIVIVADGKEVVGNFETRNITNFLFMSDSTVSFVEKKNNWLHVFIGYSASV